MNFIQFLNPPVAQFFSSPISKFFNYSIPQFYFSGKGLDVADETIVLVQILLGTGRTKDLFGENYKIVIPMVLVKKSLLRNLSSEKNDQVFEFSKTNIV